MRVPCRRLTEEEMMELMIEAVTDDPEYFRPKILKDIQDHIAYYLRQYGALEVENSFGEKLVFLGDFVKVSEPDFK